MSESIQPFLILGFLIPLIIVTIYLLKKFMIKTCSADKKIEIKAQLHVGTKERILLVKANDKSFLIGATPQAINTLHVFDQSEQAEQFTSTMAAQHKISSLGKSLHG